MEGNLHFRIDWASLIVGRKLTVFDLFQFVFEGDFQVQAPGGAYIWRGLFSGFYGMPILLTFYLHENDRRSVKTSFFYL